MTHHMEALGWTLVHFCWQAAAIALVYRVADLAFARARSNVRYLLALAALLAMLTASVVTLGYEEVRSGAVTAVPAYSSQSDMATLVPLVPIFSAQSMNEPRHFASPQTATFMVWLDLAWLLGVMALGARTLGGWWLIRRLRHTALLPVPEPVQRCFDAVRVRLGIRRNVEIYLSEKISGPMTVGVFRALVLVPLSAIASLDPEQLEVVLAHELAHVQRADYLWNLVQTLVETLFFFHPAVWWIGGKLRQQRELCCDDVAIASCSDPVVYASALLRLEEQRRNRLHLAMALDGNQSRFSLRRRIGRILGEPASRESARDVTPASALGVCAALAILLVSIPQVFASLHIKSSAHSQAQLHLAMPHADLAAPSLLVGPMIEENASPATATANVTNTVTHAVVETVVRSASAKASTKAAICAVTQDVETSAKASEKSSKQSSNGQAKADYIDQMKAAGYDVDLDKYIGMRVQGITPEYARRMAQSGLGKPSVDELIAMKVQGVRPEDVSRLHSLGIVPNSFQDLVEYRIFDVSPEYVAGMKSAGFDSIPSKKLVELRVQGVTPEFAKSVKAQFPEATVRDLVQMQVFQIDGPFIASAKRHGFTPLTIDKLVKLRISGVLGEEDSE